MILLKTVSIVAASLVVAGAVHGSETDSRAAVQKSLSYLDKEGQWWIDKKKCVSCHHTGFLIWSHRLATSRGIASNSTKLENWTDWAIGQQLSRRKDEKGNYQPGVVGGSNIEGLTQLILGSDPDVAGRYRKELSDFRELIRAKQEDDHSWKPGGQLPSQKRPLPETRAVSTMWAALALDAFGGDDVRDRALAYLRENSIDRSKSTEHAAIRLIVSSRFGTDTESAGSLNRLLARQNPDGGWSWSDGEPSGPLATGQALFALAEAGVDLDAFQSAVDHARQFLTKTQRDDGSWETRSTKTKNQGKSTDVSDFYGSAWAVIGLCRTLPAKKDANLTAR